MRQKVVATALVVGVVCIAVAGSAGAQIPSSPPTDVMPKIVGGGHPGKNGKLDSRLESVAQTTADHGDPAGVVSAKKKGLRVRGNRVVVVVASTDVAGTKSAIAA